MFGKSKLPYAHFEAQANEKLALYVYEYLVYSGAQKAAQTFLQEIQWEKPIVLTDRPGFLFSWWSVFYDLYCAAPERRDGLKHSNDARAFHDYGFINTVYSPGSNQVPGMSCILGSQPNSVGPQSVAAMFRSAGAPCFVPSMNGTNGLPQTPHTFMSQQQRLPPEMVVHTLGSSQSSTATGTQIPSGMMPRQQQQQHYASGGIPRNINQTVPPSPVDVKMGLQTMHLNNAIGSGLSDNQSFNQLESGFLQNSGGVSGNSNYFRNLPALPIASTPSVTLRHQPASCGNPRSSSSITSTIRCDSLPTRHQQRVCNGSGGGGPSLNSSSSASSFSGSPNNVIDQQLLATSQQHSYHQLQQQIFQRSTPVKMSRSQTTPNASNAGPCQQWAAMPQPPDQMNKCVQQMLVTSFNDPHMGHGGGPTSVGGYPKSSVTPTLSSPHPLSRPEGVSSTSTSDPDSFPLLFDPATMTTASGSEMSGTDMFTGFFDAPDAFIPISSAASDQGLLTSTRRHQRMSDSGGGGSASETGSLSQISKLLSPSPAGGAPPLLEGCLGQTDAEIVNSCEAALADQENLGSPQWVLSLPPGCGGGGESGERFHLSYHQSMEDVQGMKRVPSFTTRDGGQSAQSLMETGDDFCSIKDIDGASLFLQD